MCSKCKALGTARQGLDRGWIESEIVDERVRVQVAEMDKEER